VDESHKAAMRSSTWDAVNKLDTLSRQVREHASQIFDFEADMVDTRAPRAQELLDGSFLSKGLKQLYTARAKG
jgi:hypothetical protein